MAVLKIKNPIPNGNDNPKTYLSQAVNAGDTAVNVATTAGFTSGRFLQVGETGNEMSEIKQATAVPTNTQFTTASVSNPHAAQTAVYEIRYDQIKIYRTRSGVESLLATISIQPGAWVTQYTDTTSQAGDTYTSSFYNSVTSIEAPKAGYITLTGYASNTLIRMRQRAKELFRDTNNRFSDDTWNTFINESYDQLYQAALRADENYALLGPITNTSGTATDDGTGTIFTIDSNIYTFKWLWVSFDGTTFVKPSIEDLRSFDPNYTYSQTYPKFSFTGTSVIIRPGSCSAIKYFFYPKLTELSLDADVPIAPMDSYARLIVDGAVSRAFSGDKNLQESAAWDKRFMDGMEAFIGDINDRQVMDNGHIEVTDDSFLEGFEFDFGPWLN